MMYSLEIFQRQLLMMGCAETELEEKHKRTRPKITKRTKLEPKPTILRVFSLSRAVTALSARLQSQSWLSSIFLR